MGITALVGESNTAKSLDAKVALSMYGMHDSGFFSKVTLARIVQIMSTLRLPIVINDFNASKDMEQIIIPAFKRSRLENCRAKSTCELKPIDYM